MFKHLLFIVLSISILSACGTYNAGETQGEGSVSFSLEWERPSIMTPSNIPPLAKGGEGGFIGTPQLAAASPDICVDYGITTISAYILDSSNATIKSASWSCSSHSGTISGVPSGSSYMIRLEGANTSSMVTWRGEKTSISVTYGSTTSAGSVTMTYIGSDITAPTVSSVSPSSGAANVAVTTSITATFTLKQGTTTVNGSVTYNSTTKTATFTPSANLSYSTTYTATITTGATDMAGNAMVSSYSWDFTTDRSLLMGGSIQGTPLNLTSTNATVTTFVGSAGLAGSTDATGTAARLNVPDGITTDGTNLFVADNYNHVIRKVVISTGAVTTIAGSVGVAGSTDGIGTAARFNFPYGITTDGTNLFVTDHVNHTIRKIVISTGVVTTLAGSAGSSGSIDGTGSAARFNLPLGITTDGTNLFVVDYTNHTIRQIVISTGTVTTIAGTAGLSGSTDGIGSAARFNLPQNITTDGTYLFVADGSNHTIRKIVIPTGTVTTIAGSAGLVGSTGGIGTAARFNIPCGITTDGITLFVADSWDHAIRRIVISTGVVTTIAGSAGLTGSTDATGTAARFNNPAGITTDGTNLFVTDYLNYTIRKIVLSTGVVTTFAGSAGLTGSTDGTGAAARFYGPHGMTTDGTNLFVAEEANHTIRKIVMPTGVVTTIAGSAGLTGSTDGTGTAARFNAPTGITTDGTNLFVVDSFNNTIRKVVISTGAVTTIGGSAGSSGSTDGTGTAARFNYPMGITTDGTNLFVTDRNSHTIRKIVIVTGVVTALAGNAGNTGSTDGTGTAARFYQPYKITTDGTNLYVTDNGNNTRRKIVISTGVVTTLAGTAGTTGSTDGTGAAARFNSPVGITTDGSNLFVTQWSGQTVRKIVISTGVVGTVAGSPGISGSTDGTGSGARFYWPQSITTDGVSLFLADGANNTIRKIQ